MRKLILACAALLSFVSSVYAEGAYRRFDNAIRRFLMGGMDTCYVRVPAASWEIPVVTNVFQFYNAVSPAGGAAVFDTGAVPEVGVGIGYHGLDYVYTRALGENPASSFTFDYNDNAWGIGINTCEGRSTTINGYVALNGSRYSLPAACYANYIQTRSAGSPLVSFWYMNRKYPDVDGMSPLNSGAISAGYGYNWSFAEGRYLVNAVGCVGTTLPVLGVSATARLGGVVWINDSLRLHLWSFCFASAAFGDRMYDMVDVFWRTQFGAVYCF